MTIDCAAIFQGRASDACSTSSRPRVVCTSVAVACGISAQLVNQQLKHTMPSQDLTASLMVQMVQACDLHLCDGGLRIQSAGLVLQQGSKAVKVAS